MRVLRTTIAQFRQHRGFFMAAGLAFSFLTCLVPILFFIVSLAGFVLSRGAAADAVLNQIFVFTKGTGFLRGALKDILLLFLMGVMFLASILVFDIFGWIRILLLAPLGIRTEWISSLTLALALGFSSTFFFIAYRYFPHRKIPAGAALAGALLAAVLFETAKQIFRWYILRMGVYDRIYGPLGALVGLAMFSYYTGVVFILGAEFVAALT